MFRTDHIPEIVRMYGDQYFIKRLIGTPGDSIELKGAHDLPERRSSITGSKTFDLNFNKCGPVHGLRERHAGRPAVHDPIPGASPVTVPPRSYLALGDNSHNSMDSRYWGFVPEKDVIGRPLFIYYPFTNRWGTAR